MDNRRSDEKGAVFTLIERMAEAGANWLASLSTDQREKAQFPFPNDEERRRWYYTPTEQGGLPLVEMEPTQARLAHRLLSTGLSVPGYATASTIMGLENVLDAKEGFRHNYEGRNVPHRGRDPMLYFISVFGEPGSKRWGWRAGGHHISLSHTVVDGELATPTPIFFGANPAETRLVGSETLRPLAGEEDLGRELLHSLDADQRSFAVLSPIAPRDIVQANRPTVDHDIAPPGQPNLTDLRYEKTPRGISAQAMNGTQRQVLDALVHQYVGRLPEEAAKIYLAKLEADRTAPLHFAWAGTSERRGPHYYRIQGGRLLIEYDNTQNDANHIHAVLRDPIGDFGGDLLARHYQEAH